MFDSVFPSLFCAHYVSSYNALNGASPVLRLQRLCSTHPENSNIVIKAIFIGLKSISHNKSRLNLMAVDFLG